MSLDQRDADMDTYDMEERINKTLVPCAFCGGPGAFESEEFIIVCKACDFGYSGEGMDSVEQLVAQWSRRPESDKAKDRVIELARRLETRYSPEALSVMMGHGFVVELRKALAALDATNTKCSCRQHFHTMDCAIFGAKTEAPR